MPRKKSFHVDEIVDSAKQTFWQKGYVGTSINDLLDATGLKRGSLYNTFGGKKALFIKTLLKYDRENRRASLSALEAMDSPLEAIRALFDGLVQEAIGDTEKKGCLLVNTALELPMHDREVEVIVTSGLRDLEGFFVRLIELGQARGEISEAIVPIPTAKALVTQVVGIRVLARGAFEPSALATVAQQAMRLLEPLPADRG